MYFVMMLYPTTLPNKEVCSSKIQVTGAELAVMDINFLKVILGEK